MHTPHRSLSASTHLSTLARRGRWLAFPLTMLLATTLTTQTTARAAPEGWKPPKPKDVAGVPVHAVKPTTRKPLAPPASTGGPQKVAWPAAGSAQVDLTAAKAPQSLRTAATAAPSAAAQAGSLPVRVAPAPADTKISGRALTAADRPGRVSVTMHDRAAADRAGVNGVLLSLSRPGPAPQTAAAPPATAATAPPSAVSLSVDYSGFSKAYGGDWASRLRLVQLPACALSTPGVAGCTTATPMASVNNPRAQTLTATAPLAAASSVLAATSGASGDNGDYSATDLSSSATWNVGHQTGDFTWSVPVKVPDASGAVGPSLGLGYSSGSVDGLTGATNTQGGWAGDGWSMWPGFIERRYNSCADSNPQHKTGDLCWFNSNATLSLNGHAGELIKDGPVWRLKNDDGTIAEKITDNARGNGDNDNEYWKVTTADGVQFFFGYHKLPGWSSGNPVTDSTWTVPVYGDDADDPCHDDDFDKAWCQQAWRWNLDYVVDPHGNSMAYFYGHETGAYGRNLDADKRTTYDRGGYLKRVEYGMRRGAEYDQAAPLRVVFDTAERCKSDCWNGAAWDSTPKKSAWPDTPWDQYCEQGDRCTDQISPTFWSSRRLAKITTQKRTGASAYADIDSWTLRQDFINAGTGESTPMWLSGVTHTGLLKDVADDPNPHDPESSPEITFGTGAEPLDNRVDAVGDGRSDLARWRIKQIRNESGGDLIISYSPESDCDRDHLPKPDSNTTRCMPAYYSWPGTGEPTLDWFHKYVVTRVDQNDLATDQPSTTTFYDYLDAPAWHYQDDEITKDKFKTWGDWRGYSKMRVRQGIGTGEQSVVEYRYLRGMDGDKLADGGKRSESVSDWGGTVTDHEALNGFLRQEITYNGATGSNVGPEISATVNTPWRRGPTATRTRSGVTTNAYMVHTGTSRTRTALAAGGYRYRTTTSAFNDDGLATTVNDTGDEAVSTDDTCIRNTYARNSDAWILDKVVMSEKLSVPCADAPETATPATVVSRTRTFYDTYTDDASFGKAPTRGDVVRVEQLDSWSGSTPKYARTQSSAYDAVGRVTATTDARGYTTSTDYTVTNGLVTRTVVTNPLQQKTTTTVEPAWGASTTISDANKITATLRYDAFGRLTTVWLPGTSTSAPADTKFTYKLRQTGGPSYVTADNLLHNGTYKKSVTLYDGFLRQRQLQTPATGGGRLLTDTFYTTRGVVDWTSEPYYDSTNSGVSTDLGRPQGQIPAINQTVYDGAGRAKATILTANGTEKWRTTTTYGGDRTSVTPPSGGTATTTLTDIAGRPTVLRQYKNPADVGKNDPALFDTSRFTYDLAGNLKTLTDAAGNTWSYTYDLRGRRTAAKDPDTGTSTTTYDAAGNISTATDSLNHVLAYTYDELGRKTSVRDGSATGTKRAEWLYDTLTNGIGKLTKSIRWAGGVAYENRVDGYNTRGAPTGTSVVLPASAGALCASESAAPCTYSSPVTYKSPGTLLSSTRPQAGGMAKEKLTFGYNDVGAPTSIISPIQIYADAGYNKLGQPISQTFGNYGSRVAVTSSFDEPTRRLMSTNVVPELKNEAVNFGYEYANSGNVTKITDTAQGQTPDIQCFDYDYLGRLTTARTTATNDCGSAPGLGNLGSSSPYWYAWQYNTIGNRTKETRYAAAGNAVTDYAYPASGSASVRPHALTQVITTIGGQSTTRAFGYDNAGNTTTRTTESGTPQTLTWDAESHLDTLTEAGKTTAFIYDADGNRLIRKTPSGSTLYLPDGTEVAVAAGSSTATATRYYNHLGATIAMRTTGGLNWIVGDHHGTAELTIAASGLAVTKRRTLPFGDARSNPTGWPTAFDKGFLGGTKDPTELTHLGAREYDPGLGRFISVDPLQNTADPQQWNAYAYAGNNPATLADPSGLMPPLSDRGDVQHSSCYDACQRAATASYRRSIPSGTAEVDYTEGHPNVCVRGYFCMDDRQVTRPHEYINAYNAELDRSRAKWGELTDVQISNAMATACMAHGDQDPNDNNCSTWTYNDLQNIAGAKTVAAYEKAHGVNKFRAAEASGFAILEFVAGLPGCMLKGAVGADRRRSFSGDTEVFISEHTTKKIKDLRAGDEVFATDPETGDHGLRTVDIVWVHKDDLYTLIVNGERLTTTEDHPFWNDTDQQWERADQLDVGDRLRTPDGAAARVDGFTTATHHIADAYNLTIDGIHTYYVLAGNTPVLVHNDGEYPTSGTIVSRGTMKIQIYANDHGPPHAHLKDGKFDIQIGQNGKPLNSDVTLNSKQQAFVDENIKTIRGSIGAKMREYRLSGGGC
ncbi:polymorphic toxin-type HINT domain-containing protein [Krasilnikovia sp. M28-CT-15]|uniref:polymorphic toxin-type HINT domain-containing protein n=1 Tax=Krasilnikovia sp. M28-CT-15 TaxID=3373540 RepID=UPI00399C9B4E